MSILTTSEAREHFSEVINMVAYGKERQILCRRGKELVAMIPIEELRWLEELENQADLAEAKAELKKAKTKGAKPWKTIKNELRLG